MRGKTNLPIWPLCVQLLITAVCCTAAAGGVIYVDADATGVSNGSSWEDGYRCLQDALANAQSGDEIRVANGIYRPDQQVMMRRDQPQVVSSGEWTATFQLIDGVAIKGGYAGFGEPDSDARDVERYSSVLSGDLNADDGPGFTNIADNCYQVVTAGGTEWTTVLDGFTITGGNADGPPPYNHGGGIYNVEGSPTLIDCTITGNSTMGNGGGMENENSNPALLNCILAGNSADGGGGGGMCNYRSNPTLANCKFMENSAAAGGGMFNEESKPMLSDCAFNRNTSSAGSGGGMFNENGNPVLLSCIFSENSAPRRSGGGMHSRSNSQPILSNCIFTGNSATNGGGMENIHASRPTLLNCTFSANFATQAGGGISSIQDSRPILVNCILWDNSDESGAGTYSSEIHEQKDLGQAEVMYSCIQDSINRNPWPGEGNINTDPFFVNPENGDYHLKSHAGRWDQNSQGWVIDQMSSPCIDAGDPSTPVGLERFPNGGRINMGAYGGTPEASLSSWQTLPVTGKASNPYPADGAVDIDRDVVLNWTSGLNAVYHDVYLGPDGDAVANADTSDTTGTYRGRQATTSYTPPEVLRWSTMPYYWRIDQVDSQGNTTTGDVWTFTTIPPPPPKGRTCFTAETNVWASGALVPISSVGLGQNVGRIDGAGVPGSPVRLQAPGKVEEVQEHEGTFVCYDVLLESGNCIGVAECHYFLTESGRWISLQNLRTGARLQTSRGSIGIISVTKRPMPYVGKVYNLKVEGSDRYPVGEDAVIVRDY
jgi:hypothetical protein